MSHFEYRHCEGCQVELRPVWPYRLCMKCQGDVPSEEVANQHMMDCGMRWSTKVTRCDCPNLRTQRQV